MSERIGFESRGNFISGAFALPEDPNGSWEALSPADATDCLGTVSYSFKDIDRAVDAARSAFRAWRALGLKERGALLKKYQEQLKRREDQLVQAIARESGKPLWEAKTEFKTMIGKVDVTIKEGLKFTEDYEIPEIQPGAHGTCRFRPLGVLAVLGPFNFPGHLPNGHIVPALLTGNTIIFKPSEKTPIVGQLMVEAFSEAGFPSGVVNLIQGEKEVGRRLSAHEGVAGVLFTGSYEVGTRIKQETLQQHWKLLALEMGGKNPAIVWKDCDFDVALREVLIGAYITTGQRCSCTSLAFVHESLIDRFVESFHAKAKAFEIGHPLDNPFMGPLISRSIVDRYLKFLGIAQREGCDIVMRGKKLELDYEGNYVAPSVCRVKEIDLESFQKSVYLQTELFSPNLAVIPVRELEEVLALANATQYGLVASLFTKSRKIYEQAWNELEFGLVNWNKTTVGASGRLPFGGVKKSGNHFPTGVSASQYCTFPVASLELEKPNPAAPSPKTYPGLNWA